METVNSNNPKDHTENIKREFAMLANHLREDVQKVGAPATTALPETSAEVISGLETAFSDYERKNDAVWKSDILHLK